MAFSAKLTPSTLAITCVILLLGCIIMFKLKADESTKKSVLQKISVTNAIFNNIKADSPKKIIEVDTATDFSFLDKDIDNKSIVLLGEQQHGDGSTFKVKSGIIQYLHQKGFSVVLFESSFFETAKLWQNIKSGHQSSIDFSKAIYPFWGRSDQTQSIRAYILKHSASAVPLEIAGIDYQIPYAFSQEPLVKELKAYLKHITGYHESDFKSFWKSLENKNGPALLFNTPLQKVINKDSCMREIWQLHQLVSNKINKSRTDLVFEQYLYNIYHFYFAKITYRQSVRSQGLYRDSILFENVKWQLNNLHKGKKVAIWTANFHAAYPVDDEKPNNLGAHLKRFYKNQVYSILFTSLNGKTLNIGNYNTNKLNDALPYTFESVLNNHGHHFTYVRCPQEENLRNSLVTMRFMGHNNVKDKWFQMMDSFIFIDSMKPATFLTTNLLK